VACLLALLAALAADGGPLPRRTYPCCGYKKWDSNRAGDWSLSTMPRRDRLQPRVQGPSEVGQAVARQSETARPCVDTTTSALCRSAPPEVKCRRACKLLCICLAPIPLAILPVAMPFGNPYGAGGCQASTARNWNVSHGTSSSLSGFPCTQPTMDSQALMYNLRENWAYFFWYTPTGWAGLWLAMTVWSAGALRYQSPPLRIRCAPLIVLGPTLCACTIYTAGAWLVFPFPLGTFSLGVPAFGCYFAFLVACCTEKPTNSQKPGVRSPPSPCSPEAQTEEAGGGHAAAAGSRKVCQGRSPFCATLIPLCMFWTMWISTIFFFVQLTHMDSTSEYMHVAVQLGFMFGPQLAVTGAAVVSRGMSTMSQRDFNGVPPFSLWWLYSVAIYKSFILPTSSAAGSATELIQVQVSQNG
jgi:hypothetical protein